MVMEFHEKPRDLAAVRFGALPLATVAFGGIARADSAAAYPWLASAPGGAVESRVPAPSGWRRLAASPGSFAAWLRSPPVKPGRPDVLLFNGSKKWNQEAHHVVLDIDVGKRDRQQCADAVMRLRAEYLHQAGQDGEICFRFTNGTCSPSGSRANQASSATTGVMA